MNDEKKILEFDEGRVVLTSRRVRYDTGSTGSTGTTISGIPAITGQREIVSIMLDELCSCKMSDKSKIIFLILAALSGIVSLVFMGTYFLQDTAGLSILSTIAFVAAWFWTRKQALSLSSAGATINILTKRMSTQACEDFIDAVELAKFEIRNK